MSIDRDGQELDEALALIEKLVQVDQYRPADQMGELKLDVLERTIELIRIKRKCLRNGLPLEEFIQGNILNNETSIRYISPERIDSLGSGTTPIHLQPKLLLFLLLYHRENYRVLDIIERFIEKVWDSLKTVDFKRTETGVLRCYTNTRFSANTLREYGLLKFTKKEAYKTWILSLPGFLVASLVLEKYKEDWQVPRVERLHNYDLHNDILAAKEQLETYDDYVGCLARICEPNLDLYKTFGPVLKRAYSLLNDYWEVMRDHKLNIADRQKASMALINKIDQIPDSAQFYSELSKSINLERVLSDV